MCANQFGKPSQFCMSWHINVCITANKFVEILLFFRRVYGFIYMAAAAYLARVKSRKLHCDVMKTKYS